MQEKLSVKIGADIKGFKSGLKGATDFAVSSAKKIVLAFTGLISASALVGSKFQKELINTATVAQAFGKDLEALENKAREIGKTTAFTASQAAAGMYDLACLPGDEYILGGDFRVHKIGTYSDKTIIGKNGTPQKIKEFTSRRCKEGNIYNIKPRGLRSFRVTGNHPIYAIKSKWCKPSKENVVLCKSECNQDCNKKYYEKYKPEWIPAEDLKTGDILLQPIIKEEKDIKINWEIKKKLKRYNLLPKIVDENFARFLGLIIGDGWADNKNERVFCSFSNNDILIKKWYINYINNIGYSCQEKQMSGCIQVVFWSKPIATLIDNWIGKGSGNKRIPPDLFYAKKEIILSFLKGYIESDSCLFYKNDRAVISITTISPHIAYFINLLSSKIGGVFSILFDDKKKTNRQIVKMPSGYTCELQNSYSLRITDIDFISKIFNIKKNCKKLRYKKIWMDDDYVYYPIYKIDSEVFYGKVYNFETEDNTYSTGIIVHNSAGMKTREIVGSVESAMLLAGATASELSLATHMVASSMKQFGMNASESRRITDTFAAAITNSLLTMEKLNEAMKFAGTTGAALGWTIEETTAAVAQFADLGLEGSMSGTNLRMSMIHLTSQTRKVTEALAEMGLKFEDINPETHKFGEILDILGTKLMTSKQAVELFGSRAGLNMKQLAELAVSGATDYSKFVDMLKESQEGAGRTLEMYNRMMDTFWGQWKVLWSAVQELGITVFDTYKDEAKTTFSYLAKELNSFSESIKKHTEDIKIAFYEMTDSMVGGIGVITQSIGLAIRAMIGWKMLINSLQIGLAEASIKQQEANILSAEEHIKAAQNRIDILTGKISRTGILSKIGNIFTPNKPEDILAAKQDLMYWERAKAEAEETMKLKRESAESGIKGYEEAINYLEKLDGLQEAVLKKLVDIRAAIAKQRGQIGTVSGMSLEEFEKYKNQQMAEDRLREAQQLYRETILASMEKYGPKPEEPIDPELLKAQQRGREDQIKNIARFYEVWGGKVKEQAKIQQDFYREYNNLGKDSYDLRIQEIENQAAIFKDAMNDEVRVAEWAAKKIKDIEYEKTQALLGMAHKWAGGMADSFRTIAEAGARYSKEAFMIYKAFAIVDTVITTISASMDAYKSALKIPYVGMYLAPVAAAATMAAGMAKVAMIKSQAMPSYDEGGVSEKPGVYYSGVPEAHIPLKSGKVPVQVQGNAGNNITIKMENPVFQDVATQRQVFRMLAEEVVRRTAPSVVYNDYQNDGRMRKMVRGRA